MNIKMKDLQKKFGKKAKELANDKRKVGNLLDRTIHKVGNLDMTGSIDELYDHLKLLYGLVKDWSNGTYTDIEKGKIVIIVIGLLYVISPFDVIPDFLPGGLVDDLFVLGLVIKQVNTEIEKYNLWKQDRETVVD